MATISNESKAIFEKIKNQGLLPLYFHQKREVSLSTLQALYEAGIRVVEYTNRGEAALENFKAMLELKKASMPDLLLGIGTIKNEQQAEAYHQAGADFLISPCFYQPISDYVQKHNLTWIPGCMTASEINLAEQNGVGFVKLFPGNLLGPSFVSAIKPLFPDILFMPTGGVSLEQENITAWFKSGVSAVGMGSKLITKAILENEDYTTLTNTTQKVLTLTQTIKNNL
ncbi:2-dehydro-3-deoxyphosphogluconate aldolase / (4S)-4-hydroxy-2-oxoglutarate aldolase [Arachidicoccus rhizosphaerae]|jgi:2-dehydro-3-deoxyphosphogluconate aldolase/(4S)-4-hydroxy-2-oxoglutarate aldolase|uniref:2-dehydro-3-deoxyphosphogluconate aldolase / (4S)-4-hydroxy-2-oxoglutarate aldolase n=1 Tax=Arachidicoccus rhizosphaerae TaxID=551991 RepID=A0A1H4AXR0_9BACT|nr:bifunctional 4-hydroxy-2-oxoglutarate aldolase/2-dehydro-3-deoxy-phosphogluconate aldolase [Arachidicoccus rhizosphaerae]SEA40626.1 2-dehydro-3-deoxyphosphogluconate aldolase / (4S)-4-hydroxy-2-oxoglutarate aldolase [Arachidicoccus rhizosphaerae]